MSRLVDDGLAILLSPPRPLHEFGALLHQGWCLKRTLSSQVSSSRIDAWYDRARAAGAIGGKLLGAGGGGFLLFLAAPDRHADICRAVPDLRRVPFHFESEGSTILLQQASNS
jgi:D-glycero-alpha-D-manno-heptose-7-phosphate kinase